MNSGEKSITGRINFGYDHIEPVIIGLMAQNMSFILVGRHGAGKTRLVKFLSKGFGREGFVFYDATKDDMISVAGIPDPEAMKKGDLRFLQHQRGIWNKTTIVVDEITRASKENQNLWLEILEEKTCFGLPLIYQSFIATANPESYAAANRLDEALLDRFYAVVNIPEHQGGIDEKGISEMIDLTFHWKDKSEDSLSGDLVEIFSTLKLEYKKLTGNKNIMERVKEYCSAFSGQLLMVQKQKEAPVYISPRTYCRNFPEVLLAVAAYLKLNDESEFLMKAADYAYTYAFGTKLKIRLEILEEIHEMFASILSLENEVDSIDAIRVDIGKLSTLEQKVLFCQENALHIAEKLPVDEVEKFVSSILNQVKTENDSDKLIDLSKAVRAIKKGHEELSRKIDGKLLLSLNSAITKVSPFLHHMINTMPSTTKEDRTIQETIRQFLELCGDLEKLMNASGPLENVKRYLLDVYDGDEVLDEERAREVFSALTHEDLNIHG